MKMKRNESEKSEGKSKEERNKEDSSDNGICCHCYGCQTSVDKTESSDEDGDAKGSKGTSKKGGNKNQNQQGKNKNKNTNKNNQHKQQKQQSAETDTWKSQQVRNTSGRYKHQSQEPQAPNQSRPRSAIQQSTVYSQHRDMVSRVIQASRGDVVREVFPNPYILAIDVKS